LEHLENTSLTSTNGVLRYPGYNSYYGIVK